MRIYRLGTGLCAFVTSQWPCGPFSHDSTAQTSTCSGISSMCSLLFFFIRYIDGYFFIQHALTHSFIHWFIRSIIHWYILCIHSFVYIVGFLPITVIQERPSCFEVLRAQRAVVRGIHERSRGSTIQNVNI